MIEDLYEPRRFTAIVKMLLLESMESWVIFGFIYADQQISESSIRGSGRAMSEVYDMPASDTTPENIYARYQGLLGKVYAQEKQLSANAPLIREKEQELKKIIS